MAKELIGDMSEYQTIKIAYLPERAAPDQTIARK
jgi:hypothetical protein